MESGSPITSRKLLTLLGSACVGVAVLHFALPSETELADEPLLEARWQTGGGEPETLTIYGAENQ